MEKDPNKITITGASSRDVIDLLNNTSCSKLELVGLNQDTFEYLIDKYGRKFSEISFFKCPLIGDLSDLEKLTNIEKISFYWNQRATELWDLSKNKKLYSIEIDDFTRLHSLSDLVKSESLKELSFGDKVWSSLKIESLEPLSNIKKLEKLYFSAKKIEDPSVFPLTKIKYLQEIEFPTNLFTTEKVAWLTAKLNGKVKSSVLAPYRGIKRPFQEKEKNLDILIIGKRKPFLDSKIDSVRVEKYVNKFNDLVKYYLNHPNEEEPK
ncbi:MAG: hypothetical protein AB8B80_10750 [Marinicellaceae bacterium]